MLLSNLRNALLVFLLSCSAILPCTVTEAGTYLLGNITTQHANWVEHTHFLDRTDRYGFYVEGNQVVKIDLFPISGPSSSADPTMFVSLKRIHPGSHTIFLELTSLPTRFTEPLPEGFYQLTVHQRGWSFASHVYRLQITCGEIQPACGNLRTGNEITISGEAGTHGSSCRSTYWSPTLPTDRPSNVLLTVESTESPATVAIRYSDGQVVGAITTGSRASDSGVIRIPTSYGFHTTYEVHVTGHGLFTNFTVTLEVLD